MAGTREGGRESIVKARAARSAKAAARREQEAADRAAGVARQLATVRAKDWDEITVHETYRIGGHVYGPGRIRAQPDIIAAIRETESRRRELRLDSTTGLPDPPTGPPNHVRPIVAVTGASLRNLSTRMRQ